MKGFILVVNIMALTLPFLAAEIQDQEQPACNENYEKLVEQKTMTYVPIHYVFNRYPHYEPNYYQHRPVVSISSYMLHPYYTKTFVPTSLAQTPQWPLLPNIHHPTMAQYQPHLYPSFMAIPPKKFQDKTTIPLYDTKNIIEPTPIPTNEPVVSTVIIPEASSEFINTPETTTVPVTSSVV